MAAVRELGAGGVFADEGAGGDEGLFKGVYYRYLGVLLAQLDPECEEAVTLSAFVRSSTDRLWETGYDGQWLLASDDWRHRQDGSVFYSTQLSAIMATELRAKLETGLGAPSGRYAE